jgi:hypothetical protein
MTLRKSTTAPPSPLGSIRADEVLPLAEAGRRLGMGKRGMQAAQRAGLPVVRFGRRGYVLGRDVLDWFAKQKGVENG